MTALIMASCVEFDPEVPERAYIAPLDGQTGVPLALPLLLRTGDFRPPPHYDMPDIIRVTDLDAGGAVPGWLEIADDAVSFHPTVAWKPNHRYAWTVPDLTSVPHGPDLPLPTHLPGTAVFDTSEALDLLGASYDPLEAELCLLFSRPLTEADRGAIRITIDDVEVKNTSVRLIPPDDWGKPYELFEEDPGVDVLCTDGRGDTDSQDTDSSTPDQVRVWWGELGPWITEPTSGPIFNVALARRRGNW